LPVVSRFISERREKNANSWHAYLYRTIKDLIARHQKTELEFSLIWDAVTCGLSGDFKNESHQTFESEEFGTITRKAVSETLMQIFGAKQSSNRRESRKLIFDKTKLNQQSKYYDVDIQVRVVTDVTCVTDIGIGQYLNGCPNAAETVITTAAIADSATTIAESSMGSDDSSKQESPDPTVNLSRPSHLSQEEVFGQ
jgi:hypothetical protein